MDLAFSHFAYLISYCLYYKIGRIFIYKPKIYLAMISICKLFTYWNMKLSSSSITWWQKVSSQLNATNLFLINLLALSLELVKILATWQRYIFGISLVLVKVLTRWQGYIFNILLVLVKVLARWRNSDISKLLVLAKILAR